MKLIMSIDEHILGSAPISLQNAKDEEYLSLLKRHLHMEHRLVVASYRKRPTFYLHADSSMNDKRLKM